MAYFKNAVDKAKFQALTSPSTKQSARSVDGTMKSIVRRKNSTPISATAAVLRPAALKDPK